MSGVLYKVSRVLAGETTIMAHDHSTQPPTGIDTPPPYSDTHPCPYSSPAPVSEYSKDPILGNPESTAELKDPCEDFCGGYHIRV